MPAAFLILLLTFNAALSQSSSVRQIEVINSDWRFYKGEIENGPAWTLDDSNWERVSLPHTWNVDDSFDRRGVDDGLDITFGYYRGRSWYRKTLFLPEADRSRRIFLKFEGANQVTDLFVNETFVGQHIGGYTNFEFDITTFVKFGGENLVAVRVDNSYHYDIPPQSADYTMYGGIYRDAYLVKTAPHYLQRALISTPQVSLQRAHVTCMVQVVNTQAADFTGHVWAAILDSQNRRISETKQPVAVAANSALDVAILIPEMKQPRLWSPDSPNLYQMLISLYDRQQKVDEISEPFGLRWFRFDPNDGFFLNGKHLRLQGVNRHQDRAGCGNALSNELHVEDMRHIKSLGANFVRLAHYPQDPAVLEACDRLGLLVWEEIPVVRSVGKEKFAENAKNMLREMITQHYNHPSVIIWGLMNEVVRDQREEELYWAVNLCRDLHNLAKEIDPSRYTAQAQFKDRGTEILTIPDIIGFNKYYGWYSDAFEDFGQYIDEQKCKFPNKPFIISEYGAGSKLGFHVEQPRAPDFSESWQVDFLQSYWQQISERKFIAGSAVWNMFDFGSEEKGGNIPHINQKGLMTFDRRPKDVFYFFQSQWRQAPMVYVVSHTWRKRAGKKDELKSVEVFSNCEEVELMINGKSAGKKLAPPFIWETRFEPGINYIKAVGRKGAATVEDEISISYFVD